MVSRIILSFGILSFLSFPSLANNNLKHIVDLTKNLEHQIDEKVKVMEEVAELRERQASRAPASVAKKVPSRAPASVAKEAPSRAPASIKKATPSRAPASFGAPRKVEID